MPAAFAIGAGFQKLFDHGRVAVDTRERKRRDAIAVGGLDVGSGANQAVGHIEIVLADGPVEGGGAIGLRRVDVGFLLQQARAVGRSPVLTASTTRSAANAQQRTDQGKRDALEVSWPVLRDFR